MRCFTVLGPSQTGKSTVVEKLGSLEGTPRKSSSPYGLNLTEFTFANEAWCALDAPGPNEALAHVDVEAADRLKSLSAEEDDVALSAPRLRVIIDATRRVKIGERLSLAADPARVHVFDTATEAAIRA